MTGTSTAACYDDLAADYHLVYADWDASMHRQGDALDCAIRAALGDHGPADVLDCACGIGTQALPLAARGHRVTGSDISAVAVRRAAGEAAGRGLTLPAVAADMRRLPFPRGRFDVVVCADNSLPHLLTADDVRTALAEMRRVLHPDGLLIVTVRPYDETLRERPQSTPPRPSHTDAGRTVSFQLWHWHDDGQHYDLEHFRLLPDGAGGWRVRVVRATYWALTRRRLTTLTVEAGFRRAAWHTPATSGFFQPMLVARNGPARPASTCESEAPSLA